MKKTSDQTTENGVWNPAFEPTTEDKSEVQSNKSSQSKVNLEIDTDGAGGPARDTWGSPVEFLMSCISMSVGLGNVWRFPFTAYANGGGAFLIPYVIVLVFIGKPLYFLEMVMGQFSSCSAVKVWKVVPILKGVGYGQAIATWCIVTYYCYLMALTIYYLIASFQPELPWSVCDPEWATANCSTETNTTSVDRMNATGTTSPSEEYFIRHVLKRSDGIEDGIGLPEWRLTLCLLTAWIFIFVVLSKGIASSGKASYFTAIFPYVILVALLVRGVTLDGAAEGISFLITPQWDKLTSPQIWYAAVVQCFFSLAVGSGPIVTYSSYNSFRHKIYRDSIIISLMDTCASVLAGVTIFSILGHLAHVSGRNIQDFAQGGTGLAFISYPEVIARFQVIPQLFAVLFFLMLLTLGIGSAVSMVNFNVSIICDQFPKVERYIVTIGVCAAGFLIGIVYVTPGGQFLVELVDYFGGGFIMFVMAILETIGVCWIYGIKNFLRDVKYMLNITLGFYWVFSLAFFVPLGLLAIFVYSLLTYQPLESGGKVLPYAALAAGWVLAGFALAQIPGWGAYAVFKEKRGVSLIERFKWSFKSSEDWGPKDPTNRSGWILFRDDNLPVTWYSRLSSTFAMIYKR